MKKTTLALIAFLCTMYAFAQEDAYQAYVDSVEQALTYEHGTIELRNGVGKIIVPTGFKYLNATQAEKVLVDVWGNPKSADMTLGFILPETQGVLGDSGYVFNIQYDEIGYVKDDDADDIDYKELLEELQKETEEANPERQKEGYEPISLIGWASEPFYDSEKKILHWAKEIKFGTNETNTLNYNVRVLGRKGVLVLNAIATMPNLPLVQKDVHHVLDIVQFNDGYKYSEFDASIDNVAAWTIGGLVAGKVLAKAGFFVLILKFWKIIALAVVAFFGAIWKKIRNKKEDEPIEEVSEPEQLPENTPE